jgi:exopolysaccharide biosynthesis polyprenyl glycosylphosphotransferase
MKPRSLWHFGQATFFLIDYVLLWAAAVCAFTLTPHLQEDILNGIWLQPDLRLVGYVMPLFMALGLQLVGVQRNRAGFRSAEVLVQTLSGLAAGMFVFVLLHAVLEFSLIGRFVLGFSLLYGMAFILGSRMLIWKLAEHDSRRVLVYGSQATYETVAGRLATSRLPICLAGHVRLESLLPDVPGAFASLRRLGLFAHCEQVGAEEIVVEVPDALSPAEREALLYCTGMGIRVADLGLFFEREFERVYMSGLRESWFWGYDPAYAHPVYFAAKRALDITVSLAGLMVFAPLAPFVVFLIKLQDGGPVVYSQMRVGLHNRPFRIYKFRTMRTDAEKDGACWAAKGDARVTRLGRFLRKTRIDEVPQFWNILSGEMSFVGPRPERPEFVEVIEREVPFYRYRHLIKPGLTGWAQVNYSYGASIADAREKLAYDLYYMKYASITREMHIVLRTIVAMVRGAR